jgi:hypothetical protein
MNEARHRPRLTPPTSQGEDPALFDYAAIGDRLGFVLRSAGRHKLLFTACLVSVVAASAVLAAITPRQYQIQATVLALRSPIMSAFTNPGVNREWDAPARSAREMVMRRDNLIDLCKQTDFVNRHLASRSRIALMRDQLRQLLRIKPATDEQVLDGLVDGIQGKLWVLVGEEGTVTISMTWSNAQLAFDYVEAALQSFLKARHTAEISTVRDTIAILEAHDARVQTDAMDIANRLEEKERALRGKSTVRRTFSSVLASPPPALPEVDDEDGRVAGALAVKLRALNELEEAQRRRVQEQQAKLTEQLNVYAPEHPQVVDTRKTLEVLRGPQPQLDGLRAEVRDLENEAKRRGIGRPTIAAAAAAATTTTTVPSFSDLGFSDDPRLEYERSQLAGMLRQHGNLLERIASAKVEIDTAEAAFKYRYTVLSPPQMPKGPLKPFGLILVVAGLLGGVVFAFFAAAVADLRSGRVIERWQIERELGVTILTKLDDP